MVYRHRTNQFHFVFTDDVFSASLQAYDASKNYFLHSIWSDSYPSIGHGDTMSTEYLLNQFKSVDTNGDGFIDASELRAACGDAGHSIDQKRAAVLLSALGNDNDKVSFDSFMQLMLRVQDTSAVPELEALLVRHTLPPYLQPSAARRAHRQQAPALQLVQGAVGAQCKRLAASEGKFDVVQISNITDWMSPESAEALLHDVKGCLNDNGAVICRRLNGDYKLENVVGKQFLLDPYLDHGLKAADRSFFYSEVVVGFHKQEHATVAGVLTCMCLCMRFIYAVCFRMQTHQTR